MKLLLNDLKTIIFKSFLSLWLYKQCITLNIKDFSILHIS